MIYDFEKTKKEKKKEKRELVSSNLLVPIPL